MIPPCVQTVMDSENQLWKYTREREVFHNHPSLLGVSGVLQRQWTSISNSTPTPRSRVRNLRSCRAWTLLGTRFGSRLVLGVGLELTLGLRVYLLYYALFVYVLFAFLLSEISLLLSRIAKWTENDVTVRHFETLESWLFGFFTWN